MLSPLAAQTDSLNVLWDQNTDPDIYRYAVQRSENSTSAYEILDYVFHPATTMVDRDLTPGTLYYYRVAALDSSGNISPYTTAVSVGLPEVLLSLGIVVSDSVIAIDNVVADPDHSTGDLTVTVSQENNVTVTVESNDITVSPSPAGYLGNASFDISVEDPDGFTDVRSLSFTFSDNSTPVFDVSIPDITFDEDGVYEIFMDTVVTITGFSPSELTWSFDDGLDLDITYSTGTRIAEVRSQNPDWSGSGQITATATAPDQATASDNFQVTINPINDAPVLSITELFISDNPDENLIDLKPYAIDADNSVTELDWTFQNFSRFSFTWEDEANKIVRIAQLDTFTTETGTFQVSDPAGLSDSDPVTIRVTSDPGDVFLVEIPDQQFDEDQSVDVSVDNFVTIFSHPVSQLAWTFAPGANLEHSFDASSRLLTVQSKDADWFGQDDFVITATAPDQRSVTDTFRVTIDAVNDPPSISITTLFVTADPDSNIIDLKNYAVDVDNTSLELEWSFSNFSDFQIDWENELDRLIRVTPLNGATSESGTFTVTDPGNASDNANITIQVSSGSIFIVDAPAVRFDEDNSYDIQLDTVVTISGYAPGQLTWTFLPGPGIEYDYSASNRKITIGSREANWNGVDELIAIATAPDQTTASDTIMVTIDPVNDRPVASVGDLYVSPVSNNTYDLKLYSSDVDNDVSSLDWEFWGYTDFEIVWDDFAEKIIRINPSANASTQTGFFRVIDAFGDSDTSTVRIVYTADNTAPVINYFNTLTMAEDSTVSLNLVTYITDSTHTIAELDMDFDPGSNMNVFYDETTHRLDIFPDADWFGESTLDITATDPLGLSDQLSIAITVERRNDIETLSILPSSDDRVSVSIATELPSTVDFSYWNSPSQIITVSLTNFLTQHTLTLANLESEALYHFTLRVTDETGQVVMIEDSTFTPSMSSNIPTDEVVVFPNPIKPSQGHREMIFINLPETTRTIALFDLVGTKLFEQELGLSQNQFRLNVVDNEALGLTSGLYIYVVKDQSSQVIDTGKVVFIR